MIDNLKPGIAHFQFLIDFKCHLHYFDIQLKNQGFQEPGNSGVNPERTCHCNSLSDANDCSSVIHPIALVWARRGAVKPGHFFYRTYWNVVIVRVLQEWEGDRL